MRTRLLLSRGLLFVGFATLLGLGAAACGDGPTQVEGSSDDSSDADVLADTSPPPDTSPDTGGDTRPTPCQSDEDCNDSEACRVDRSGDALDLLICESPPSEASGLGDDCSDDGECRSNLCLDGTCTKPCADSEQCGEDWNCDATDVPNGDGETESIEVCRPAPPDSCVTDEDCSDNATCVARRSGSTIEFVCGDPNNGGSTFGDECEGDDDCYRNLCVGGQCTGSCQEDEDCGMSSDFTCETTDVEWGDGNSDTISICQERRTCNRAAECGPDTVCYFDRQRAHNQGVCQVRNPGGAQLGDSCGADDDCEANLCYDGRFQKVCSVPCSSDSDCNRQGYRCETTSVADGQGGSFEADVCVPAPPAECSRQDDCTPDEACAIVPTPDGQSLESVCIPNPDGVATGNACTLDDDCQSQVCTNGTCASSCTDRDQCASDQVCRDDTIDKAGISGTFQVCETLDDERCTSSGTCSDGVRLCSQFRDTGGSVEAYCQFPNDSASGSLGDSCSAPGDCETNLCLGQITQDRRFPNECSVVCRQNSQCGSDQVCTTLPLQNSDIAACTRKCSSNNDCSSANICQANLNELTDPNSIDTVCTKPLSGANFGETCSANNDCQSGLCLSTTTYYTQTCTTDADCSSGRTCESRPNETDDYCAEVTSQCTRVCDADSQCSSSGDGNPLDSCDSSITLTIPDGNGGQRDTNVSACAQSQ